MTRLNKVLNDLNIGLERAQEFIYNSTGEQLGNKNSKVTKKVIDLLTEEFKIDKSNRSVARKIRKETEAISKAKRDAILKDIETARNGFKPSEKELKVFFEKYNLIKSRTIEEWSKTPQQIILDAFEKMTKIQMSDGLIDYKPELGIYLDELFKNYPVIKNNFHLKREANKIEELAEGVNIQKGQDISDNFCYENFAWGGLSGEEAYIGYWNTD